MSVFVKSSGLETTNGTANTTVPAMLCGFDVIQKTAATIGIVKVYDGSQAGTLLATGSINSEVGAVTVVTIDPPARADSGLNVYVQSANFVLRYA